MRTRVHRFGTYEAFEESNTAGLENVITVIDDRLNRNATADNISVDLMSQCAKAETAVKRLFDTLGEDDRLDGWKDCIIEAMENGYYEMSEPGEWAYGVEAYGDEERPLWYVFLNVKQPKKEAAEEEKEEPKEGEKMTYTEIVEKMQNSDMIPVSVLYDETQHTEEGGNVCEGCRYAGACGDADRVEPCEGFEEEATEEEEEENTITAAAVEEYREEHGEKAALDLLQILGPDRFGGDFKTAVTNLQEIVDRQTVRDKRREQAQRKQEEADRENFEHCRRIAQEVEEVAEGVIYKCPHCGELYNIEEAEETEEGHTCPNCSEEVEEMEAEQVTMWDYFNDALDIEYRISGSGDFRSCRLMVTCGGPNIYVDTATSSVELYWWGDRASAGFDRDAAALIDEVFEELYACTR